MFVGAIRLVVFPARSRSPDTSEARVSARRVVRGVARPIGGRRLGTVACSGGGVLQSPEEKLDQLAAGFFFSDAAGAGALLTVGRSYVGNDVARVPTKIFLPR